MVTFQYMEDESKDLELKDYFVPLTFTKACVFLAIIAFVVFGFSLSNAFVWDDLGYIINNPLSRTFNLQEIFGKNIYNTAAQYRPLTALYFSVVFSIFHEMAGLYRIVGILIHCVNAIMLLYFFKRFLSLKISFIAVLIFLIHPLQVESVAYMASAGNLLFFFFGMLGFLISTSKSITVKKSILIGIFLLLSILFKETGVLFVILVFFYRVLFYKKKDIQQIGLSIFASIFSYFIIRIVGVGFGYNQLHLSPIASLHFFERITNIPLVVFYYLHNFFLPLNLAVNQLWIIKEIDIYTFYLPLLFEIFLFLSVLGLAIWIKSKNKKLFPFYLFMVCWCVLGYGMHSQIVPLDMTVADRWFYFPAAGTVGIVGSLLMLINYKKKIADKILILASIFVLILLALISIQRIGDWKDGLSLFLPDSKKSDNFDIENNIGGEYFLRKDYKNALLHYKKSADLLPYELNLYNVGVTYQSLKEYGQAREYYLKVLNLDKYWVDKKFRDESYVKLAEVTTYYQSPTKDSMELIKKGLLEKDDSGFLWAALAYSYSYFGEDGQPLQDAIKKAELYLPDDKKRILYALVKKNLNLYRKNPEK